jgi:signal transduction histidine kinase
MWAVRVRWLVIGGFLGLAVAAWLAGVLSSPVPCGWAAIVGATLNGVNSICVRRGRHMVAITAIAVPFDHLLITYVVANTGGVESPFIMMYFVQVVATAMLVDLLVAMVSAGCAVVVWAVGMELLAAGLPPGIEPAAWVAAPGSEARLLWGAFLIYCLALLVYLGGYVGERLRASEADLREKNLRLMAALSSLQQAYAKLMQTESQLIQSEKMRALGQLVAGVAHELNNPISFVAANVEHLRSYTDRMRLVLQAPNTAAAPSDAAAACRAGLAEALADLPGLLDDCEEGARRAKEIVNQLRSFSRHEDGTQWRHTDLRRDIETTLSLLNHRLKGRIVVHRDFDRLPDLECLPGQINQVLMNLLVNAADAIGKRAGNIWIAGRADGKPGTGEESVVLTVRDDGAGMEAEVVARVFDPFFTTKEPGQGTGLGLAVTYAILERHRGRIQVESKAGQGSSFTITLPVRHSVDHARERPRVVDSQERPG